MKQWMNLVEMNGGDKLVGDELWWWAGDIELGIMTIR